MGGEEAVVTGGASVHAMIGPGGSKLICEMHIFFFLPELAVLLMVGHYVDEGGDVGWF